MKEGETIHRIIARTLGRYQVVKRIGRGGMGDVWLCDDPRLHRQVAIKTLPVHNQQDLEFSQRFEREAQATAALSHPHILSIYDYGEQSAANGQVVTYIVMPYIAGGSLADSIAAYQAKHTLMPPLEAITHLAQAAEAIDYAHEQGIVHRDIKPGNMLLRNDRWLLLTDFGIAQMLSSVENLTQTGIGIGTPEYMAPEQAQGKAVAASDIYSLAVLAYYLFTGRLPFNAETSYATTIQHMTLPPPPPRLFNPTLPPLLEAVLLHGLAKQPAERPFLARTFVADLQQTFSGMSSEISYTTQVERPQAPITPASYTTQLWQPQAPTMPTSYTTQLWQPQTPTMPTISTPDSANMPTTSRQSTQVERTSPGSEPKSGLPFSRRQMIIGGGASLAVLGGGLGIWAIASKLHTVQSSSIRTTLSVPPTPKPGPNGPDLILQGHLQPASSLAWSPKKNVLASIADQDDLLLWDITRQQSGSPDPIARRQARSGSSMQLAWSPDGNILALANTAEGAIGQDDATIDLYTGDLSNTAPGFTKFITAEGTSILAGLCWVNKTVLVAVSTSPLNSNDDKHFRLWAMDVTQSQQRIKAIPVAGTLGGTLAPHSPPVLAVSADGSLVAIALFGTIVIGQVSIAANAIQWQLRTTLQFDNGSINEPATVLWDPTGRTIGTFYVSNGSSLYFWDWQGNKNAPAKELDTDATVTAMAWCPTPKSSFIATATSDGKVLIWNANKGTTPVATLNGGTISQNITALAWSTDGQWIAAGYNDNDTSILVWKTTGRGF
jgi:eukaryotic-like serine/threonine-protein kinase